MEMMRATFILDNNNHAQSVERPKSAPHTIAVGTPVVLRCPYQTPYGAVPLGARGFVNFQDEASGALWILMEGAEPALVYLDNLLVLMPYDTDDTLDCFEFKPIPTVLRRRLGDYLRMVASFLLIS